MLLGYKIFVAGWIKVGVGLHPFVPVGEDEINAY